MVANAIWILTGKKLSGEATPQELEALESFVTANERNKQIVANLELMWLATDAKISQKSAKEIEKKWEAFRRKLMSDPPQMSFQTENKNQITL